MVRGLMMLHAMYYMELINTIHKGKSAWSSTRLRSPPLKLILSRAPLAPELAEAMLSTMSTTSITITTSTCIYPSAS